MKLEVGQFVRLKSLWVRSSRKSISNNSHFSHHQDDIMYLYSKATINVVFFGGE